MNRRKPSHHSQSTKKVTKVQRKVSKGNEKHDKGGKTPVSKKSVIAPKQFFKSISNQTAERSSTSTVQQYKPGDHLFTLQSVTEKNLQFSDEDDLDHAARNDDGNISDDIEENDDPGNNGGRDFTLSPNLDTDFNFDQNKENNSPSVATFTHNQVTPVLESRSMSNITGNIGQQGGQASTSLQPTSFDVLTLLQQQQAMLQQVIDEQAAFRSKMNETETRIIAVENLLKDSCSSSSSSGTPKRTKHRILRDLSVSLEMFFVYFVY